MTRNGKIARLPRAIRKELNSRLADGEEGPSLLAWLNGHPEVQQSLQARDGGRPLTKQNLSEWRLGGFKDWERQQEARALVQQLVEQQGDLEQAAEGYSLSDRLAGLLSMELLELMQQLLAAAGSPEERWNLLQKLSRELSQLRRDDHRAVRTRIKQERWENKRAQEAAAKAKEQARLAKDKLIKPFLWRQQLDALGFQYGGGKMGRAVAAFILETENDLPPGFFKCGMPKRPGEEPEGQSESVRPSPTGEGEDLGARN